jgi:hypothetical protein
MPPQKPAVEKTVVVRVLPDRALSFESGAHVAGDELELPEAEAKSLAAQGFVERVGRRTLP